MDHQIKIKNKNTKVLIIYSVIDIFCCIADSKRPFLPFLPLFYWQVMQRTPLIRPYSWSTTQNQHDTIFCFPFYENMYFNGHFLLFGRPYWIEEIDGKHWFAIPINVLSWRSVLFNFSCEYLCKISSKLAERFGYKLLWQTDTQTDVQTYLITSFPVLTYSVLKWLNIKKKKRRKKNKKNIDIWNLFTTVKMFYLLLH